MHVSFVCDDVIISILISFLNLMKNAVHNQYSWNHVISFSLPYGDRQKNRKGNKKGLQGIILKTGVLYKELCVQSSGGS